ncbi:MAG: cytochrome c maturation protein CcmE, partial [Actinobacteria bacterium]|nr:cytochrome c maturation protein CcmE [Actinomycetota bacterium]MCG2807815.1 cytochrome c maturation protein CcmE [Coriobacteriia bacterium]
MNKRARNRLIGVTAIILIAVAAILQGAGSKDGAYSRTVTEVAGKSNLAGERIRVSGEVVEGSWDRKSNPMRFTIRDEKSKPGAPTIQVEYTGGVPSTFGDGVVAIVTGELSSGADLIVTDDMITKCPSKYTSATEALTVSGLLGAGDGVIGKPSQVTGYIVAGSIEPVTAPFRFKIMDKDGTSELPVFWEGALPQGMNDGMQVVLGGELGADGVYAAISVALAESEKK